MRSLANRLALIFFLITLGAMTIVYVGVVPNLESSLVSDRSDRLGRAAGRTTPAIAAAIDSNAPVAEVDRLVRQAADQANARVTLLGVNRGSFGTQPFVKSDSNANADIRDLEFPAVEAAIQSGRAERATESGRDGRVVELALPLFFRDASGRRLLGSVAVYSAPLEDVEANVELVRTRILIAGLLALAAAVLAGFLVAQSLGRRVARLERVARRVSTGDFSARFPVDRDDELGRLAAALDAMQRQLAELDTARRRFIATASHELRTPIFSLGGFAELLEDDDLDERTRAEFLVTMREQVQRLQKLTTDLLDLSKLDADSLELRLEPVSLISLAQSVAEEFIPAATMKGAAIDVAGDELQGEVEAVCDPQRTAQIVRVLLDNALRHTPEGTRVRAVVAASEGPRPAAQLQVEDNGPGIDSRELPYVFDRFHTGNPGSGSGLGLAIAREMAHRMGGRLEVASQPDQTVFTLTLPLAGRGAHDGAGRVGAESVGMTARPGA
jgi:signal transduction histidine kinase